MSLNLSLIVATGTKSIYNTTTCKKQASTLQFIGLVIIFNHSVVAYACVCNTLSGNVSAEFDSGKLLGLFIANSSRLVDIAECD